MTRTEELMALAEAALEREPLDVNEDLAIYGSTSWSRVQRSFIAAANPETIKQLCLRQQKLEALVRLQHEALTVVLDCRPLGYETLTEVRERKVHDAIAAFNKFEGGE